MTIRIQQIASSELWSQKYLLGDTWIFGQNRTKIPSRHTGSPTREQWRIIHQPSTYSHQRINSNTLAKIPKFSKHSFSLNSNFGIGGSSAKAPHSLWAREALGLNLRCAKSSKNEEEEICIHMNDGHDVENPFPKHFNPKRPCTKSPLYLDLGLKFSLSLFLKQVLSCFDVALYNLTPLLNNLYGEELGIQEFCMFYTMRKIFDPYYLFQWRPKMEIGKEIFSDLEFKIFHPLASIAMTV
ncbi:hypothetical protein DVH24_018566 [Malus domestica]|uniref:Uncharacterized protein n=1 Tax=Malus domestica TaxID=3750 RepID=A0A498HPV6_MALDO|nr:hypothetical protein DVH24_018566 [Malus domestica]